MHGLDEVDRVEQALANPVFVKGGVTSDKE